MKKSYSLLLTLILISFFSILSIFIIETKSMEINNQNNLYLQTQSRLQLNFFKKYVSQLNLKKSCLKNVEITDGIYKLNANISYESECSKSTKATIDIFVNSKIKFNEVNLHEKFILDI